MKSLRQIFVFALLAILAVIAVGCGGSVSIKITVPSELEIGKSYDLSADVEGVSLDKVEWSIDDTSKATIENGKVVAKAGGSFILTAKYDSYKAYLAVTVKENQVYSIQYILDGGTLDGTQVTEFSDPSSVQLPTPVKAGFEFVGWYENSTKVTTLEAKHYNLKAHWEMMEVEMTYELNGGKAATTLRKSRTIEDDDYTLPVVSKNGFTFEGWYDNPEFSGEAITVLGASNINIDHLYAKLVEVKYPISFELNGGTCEGLPTERSYSDSITLPTPTKQGYSFDGWYEEEDFSGDKVTKLEGKNSTISKLYAKYNVLTFTVEYIINNMNATVSENKVETQYDQVYTLVTPTYDSTLYEFKGWFADEQLTEAVTSITDKDGAIQVYGKWEELVSIVTYVTNNGSFKYGSRAEVVADFITDYNEVMGTTFSLDGSDMPTGSWDQASFYKFFDKTNAKGEVLNDKWHWLSQFLYDISKAQLSSNNCNVLGLGILLGSKDWASYNDATYGVTYAYRAFLASAAIRPGTSYKSVDFTVYDNANAFWPTLAASENNVASFEKGTEYTLVSCKRENYNFGGWYDNPEFNGEPITKVSESKVVYAKWNEPTTVTGITINGQVSELARFSTHTITWAVEPADATIQSVKLTSSNPSVATIDDKGNIVAEGIGKTTITITSNSSSKASATFELEVYVPDYFKVSYETESYVEIGKDIKLNAELVKRDKSATTLEWSTADSSIATVKDGVVTGVKAGTVTISVCDKNNKDTKFDFVVTVLEANMSDVMKFVVNANESNAFTRYNLGIGAGTPAYYRDITGSASKILFQDYVIDRQFEATQAAITSNHGGTKSSTEFITVHYTGNMSPKSTAKANANYFAGGGGGTSIHYVTGNDGIYHCLDDSLVAFHAGDGTNVTFEWIPTGVKYVDGDPLYPTWGINKDSKFTINGKATTVDVPVYTGKDGSKSEKMTSSTFVFNGVEQNCINDMGLAYKVVDGEYYMGTTWWCYSQVLAGRICNKGGNLNSIGIESAVNPESDLWLTWQMTAQLVAHLMIDNKLDITRVVGHHFYSAKDCPQPLLENDLEIWWEFIDLVKTEYEVYTTYKDYTFSAKIVGEDANANDNGRIQESLESRVVTYEVTITNTKDNSTQTIKLASLVNSAYVASTSAYGK